MTHTIPVHCSFSKEVFDAGDVVTALIRAPLCPEAVIFSQAIGMLQIDGRWIKVPKTYSDGNDVVSAAGAIPHSMTNKSYTSVSIFSTYHEPLPYSHVCDEGVYVQFELPQEMLPSFVGIAGNIIYIIMISIQLPSETLRCHFPFRVFGFGSRDLSYKSSQPMSVFTASSISYCTFIAHISGLSGDSGMAESSLVEAECTSDHSCVQSTYVIRDRDVVCAVKFLTHHTTKIQPTQQEKASRAMISGTVRPGDTVRASFDFTGSKQTSSLVRLRLLQRESHTDGTRLQERVLDEQVRICGYALHFTLPLHLPRHSPSGFECPLFSVEFDVEIEFNTVAGDPLVWSVGLQVASPSVGRSQSDLTPGRGLVVSSCDGTVGCHYVDPDSVITENAVA